MAAIVATVVLIIPYFGVNKRRDNKSIEEIREKYTEEELLGMGDKSPLYRCVVCKLCTFLVGPYRSLQMGLEI